ncbi:MULTISPECIES: HPP family protein [Ramlibacter]|uniref:CBS domain-containing protein n=1 Tax=Ramlibacter pinisoli TaxID=2682844 RepID=A0A6N8IP49_9BURK|nr:MULTISPECIES: HPP family protein [Ramlibacter]MBA2963643.1 HPP family protein [Ramlibacter sp. CGMCC 1.13660]MVQ28608.1 CBS domain-containing protein [Ramlibacter pinisoli]
MPPTSSDSIAFAASAAAPNRWRAWLARLRPAPVGIDSKELARAVAGAGIGILLAALFSRLLSGHGAATAWLVAPLGASAVLVFAVPASPLAQPWSVLGGNTLAALVGIACANWIPDPALAAAVAVALAIGLMIRLRCLHPPGGASALLMVLTHTTDFGFALFPVLVNSVLLVLAGMAYNSLTGRPYPRGEAAAPQGPHPVGSHFTAADLDKALEHYNQVLDISRGDLQALLEGAEMAAYQRHLGALRCADVMSPDPIAVQFGTPLREAWELMRRRQVKALPVTDRAQRIAGIVTMADFMRHADLDQHEGLGERLRALLRASGITHTDKPEVVGQIMTRKVRVASSNRPIAELIPVFSEGGHHHIPIIDEVGKLVGIITQTDLVRALYRAVRP